MSGRTEAERSGRLATPRAGTPRSSSRRPGLGVGRYDAVGCVVALEFLVVFVAVGLVAVGVLADIPAVLVGRRVLDAGPVVGVGPGYVPRRDLGAGFAGESCAGPGLGVGRAG